MMAFVYFSIVSPAFCKMNGYCVTKLVRLKRFKHTKHTDVRDLQRLVEKYGHSRGNPRLLEIVLDY